MSCRQLYGAVVAPAAVEQELFAGKSQGVDAPDLRFLDWLQISAVDSDVMPPNIVDLGREEAEVIALGLQNPKGLLILDAQLGRRVVALHRLRYTGTLGVLIKAKHSGLLTAVAPIIESLQAQGMWLKPSIIQMALELAKEA